MKRLPIILLIVTMLLAGCIGAKRPVYDGSPTALNVVIKRDTVRALVESESEPETVKVKIWKTNDQGIVIYSVVREVPIDDIESAEKGYTLSEVIPADRSYTVAAFYPSGEALETDSKTVHAPADIMTTVSLSLSPVNHVLHKPDTVYSGGSTAQFYIEFLELGGELDYTIYLATAPWRTNGKMDTEVFAWCLVTSKGIYYSLPEITEPTKLYYQYRIYTRDPNICGSEVYYPNLGIESELPYVWFYPCPE